MQTCINCQKPKATFKCGLCEHALCKKCALFVDVTLFTFMKDVPKDLSLGQYCGPCYDEKISSQIWDYEDTVKKAKAVFVFFVEDINETRLFKRDAKPIEIEDGADNSDVLMKMAYLAIQSGYNALIDVQVTHEKVRTTGYQTTKWKGRGLPVKIDNYKPNRKGRFIGNDYTT